MKIHIAAMLLALLPGASWGQAGTARDTQLQRQQAQDQVVRKIQQSQELNRPGSTPEQKKELEQTQREDLVRQQELQDDQARRARQLEQELRSAPGTQPEERQVLQDQGFERERIQQPESATPAPAQAK
ncbi:MAG TPA: hypothetical protein VF104_02185 [Burkholderiales bacterium]